ncbi:hypothetical protein J1N35_014627, partial [Gossypium stocksii]
PSMTRSSSTAMELYPNPEQIIRCNHQLMNSNPSTIFNLPLENSLFDDPRERKENPRKKSQWSKRC